MCDDRGTERPRTVWAAACVTVSEREQIMRAARERDVTASDLVRLAVRRASGLVSPAVELGGIGPLRIALDEAGRHSNASARAANSAAARYARVMRLTDLEKADLMRLARAAAAEAAEAERGLAGCSGPLVALMRSSVLVVEDGCSSRAPRVGQVRARVTPAEAEVVDAAGAERGLTRSQMLRVLLLAEAQIATESPRGDIAVVTTREARLVRNAWRRWRNNAEQSARSLARIRNRHVGSRWLDVAESETLDDWCADAASAVGRASQTVADVIAALERCGVPVEAMR